MFRWNLRDEQYKLHKKIPGEEGFIFKVGLSGIMFVLSHLGAEFKIWPKVADIRSDIKMAI